MNFLLELLNWNQSEIFGSGFKLLSEIKFANKKP